MNTITDVVLANDQVLKQEYKWLEELISSRVNSLEENQVPEIPETNS